MSSHDPEEAAARKAFDSDGIPEKTGETVDQGEEQRDYKYVTDSARGVEIEGRAATANSGFRLGSSAAAQVVRPKLYSSGRSTPLPSDEESIETGAPDDSPGGRSSELGDKITLRRDATSECLDVGKYAEALASLFRDVPDEEAFTLGLFSPWGRGKTYLIKKVAEILEKDTKQPYYPVYFNAWKYRTSAEVWAFLYETLQQKASDTCRLLPLRVGLAKHGLKPIILILILVICAFVATSQKIDLVDAAIWFFGLIGLAYVHHIYYGTRALVKAITDSYAKVARHDDKLGLQAALGSDLRNLMIGWIPRGCFRRIKTWRSGLLAGLYVILCLIIAFPLWNAAASTSKVWTRLLPALAPATEWVPIVVSGVWIAVMIVFPLLEDVWPWCTGDKAKRVLLVIDDLDRCSPLQMLEIVECITLILDDEAIKQRVQLVILVDENALKQAIALKYEHVFEHNLKYEHADEHKRVAGDQDGGKREVNRLTRETVEKLLLIHLRLPQLDESETKELVEKYLDEFDLQSQRREEPTPGATGTHVTSADDAFRPKVSQTLSAEEKEAFRTAVTKMMRSTDGKARVWGPRAIRALIFRYQLARLLLTSIGKEFEPNSLLNALLDADPDGAPPATDDPVKRIAWQVA